MAKTTDIYNDDSAHHYKSYRPPLHELTLARSLSHQKFNAVLDIGCGVGNATIALTKYSSTVTGYDPSISMIKKAKKHPNVFYTADLNALQFNYDLIVFFGSLFYINNTSFALYQKYLAKGGHLLCCDFEIIYAPILSNLNVAVKEMEYDHTKNLASYKQDQFQLIKAENFDVEFCCQTHELIHLLLSENHIKSQLQKKYQSANLIPTLSKNLEALYPNKEVTLKAKLFSSYYKKTNN